MVKVKQRNPEKWQQNNFLHYLLDIDDLNYLDSDYGFQIPSFRVAHAISAYLILFRHRIEVLREIALRLCELSVLPPFQANATVFMSSEHFQQ